MKNMRFRMLDSWVVVVAASLAVVTITGAQAQSNAVVVRATRHASAPPLSQTTPIPTHSGPLRAVEDDDELRMRRTGPKTAVQDSVLQASPDALVLSALPNVSWIPRLNILGQGTGFPGSTVNTNPSDPNLAVGQTQVVQFVNDSFTVFNKSDGSVAYGPAHGNTLSSPLGGSCPTAPNLDEIVRYDQLANRWVMLMAGFTSPNWCCLSGSVPAA